MTGKLTRTDYHIHPNYSEDASPSAGINDYCARALRLELKEICFTTHLEPEQTGNSSDFFAREKLWLDSYFADITRAQTDFASTGLKVKAGVEIGYFPGVEKEVEKILNCYPWDFVLGAIHQINGISISSMKESPAYFRHNSITRLQNDYFTLLKEAVATGLFDCIAHVDLYRRYGSKFYGAEVFTVHEGVIEPVFAEMVRQNMGLEINTSSRRRGLKDFHPSREIIALAVQTGINIFTVGSDAHSPLELGEHLDEALELLKDFRLVNYTFTKRQPVPGC